MNGKPITPKNLRAMGFALDTDPYLPPKEDIATCYFWESSTAVILVYFYGKAIRCFVKMHKGALDRVPFYPETMADIEHLMRMLTKNDDT